MGLQFHDTLSSLIYKYVRSNVKIFSQIFDTFLYDGTVIKEIAQKVQRVIAIWDLLYLIPYEVYKIKTVMYEDDL